MIRGEGFPRRVFLARRRSTAARFLTLGRAFGGKHALRVTPK